MESQKYKRILYNTLDVKTMDTQRLAAENPLIMINMMVHMTLRAIKILKIQWKHVFYVME